MNEMKITIEAPALVQAIAALVAALQSKPATTEGPAYQAPAAVPIAVPTAPVAAPVSVSVSATPLPTIEPTYTLDQLATAGAALVDTGKQAELVSLLQQFGVPSLAHLDAAQYGAFATQMRGLGAKI